ncbi:MAG: hypothetical protein ACRDZU_16585, partial [Acidimicrobiales bacterium]
DEMVADQRWETAAEIAVRVAKAMLDHVPDDPIVVNVNVPNRPLDEIAGWRRTEVALLPPRTLASAELIPMVGHDGAFEVRMEWGDPLVLPVETDSGAVEAGYVAITALCRLDDDPSVGLDQVTAALDDL